MQKKFFFTVYNEKKGSTESVRMAVSIAKNGLFLIPKQTLIELGVKEETEVVALRLFQDMEKRTFGFQILETLVPGMTGVRVCKITKIQGKREMNFFIRIQIQKFINKIPNVSLPASFELEEYRDKLMGWKIWYFTLPVTKLGTETENGN